MSKPYFTPDPPPGSNDVAELREWLVRQIERISDWWPQDLQSRVETLETLSPAVAGTWPIIDFSTVQFNGAFDLNFDPPLSCATGTAYIIGSPTSAIANLDFVDYLPSHNMVFVSGTPTTSAGLGAAVIDADTGNVLFSQASFTRHGHWLTSDSGSVGNPTQYWLSRWTGGGTRSVDVRSLPDFSVLGTFNFGLNNATPAAESTTSVLYVGDFNTGTGVRLVNKLTLGIASFVLPAGWRFFASPSQPAALVSPSGIEEFLLPVQSIASSSVFGFVNLGLSGFGTVRQTVGSGLTTPTFFAGSCVVEEKVYWIAYDSPDNETYIVETDLAGDVLRIIPIYDFSPTGIYSGSTRKALVYVPETNGLYYTRNNELWRYSLTSDTYSKCAPAFAPEITAFGSVVTGRGGAIAYQTGTMWFCVMRISGGGTVIGYALENVPIE